jgi:hypothetical protein
MNKTGLKNNRKSTRGRKHFMTSGIKNGEKIKRNKHVYMTNHRIKVLGLMLERTLKQTPPSGGSERTQAKKAFKNRAILIWDSKKQGTFTGSVRDVLINN